MVELNPNHGMTQAMREHWQKVVAILVKKLGGSVTITEEDVMESGTEGLFLTIEENITGFHLNLVSEKEAKRLARKNGGLPT